MSLSLKITAGIALAMCAGMAQADDSAARAEILALSCANCHGPGGNSPGDMPAIHKKSEAFIASSLREYRDGESQGTVMNRIASGYTDEDIELIAGWFAAQSKED